MILIIPKSQTTIFHILSNAQHIRVTPIVLSTSLTIPLDQVFRDTCTSSSCDAKVHSRDSVVCSWIFLGARFLEVNLIKSQKTVKSWDVGNSNHKEMILSHTRSFRTSTAVTAAYSLP